MPVCCLISAAIATAPGPSAVGSFLVIVPVSVAGDAATAVSAIATPDVGPPVMTGMPCGFCQLLDPLTRVAKRP